MWIKLQCDLFDFDKDVYICNVYIPTSGSKILNSQNIDIFECLEQSILLGGALAWWLGRRIPEQEVGVRSQKYW